MTAPAVSVIIATYNYGSYLRQAVASVQAQTFTDWECLIVDDASTDSTPEIAAALAAGDARVRYHRNQANLGEAKSRNLGNAMAAGKFLAPLDADDWWHPAKLERQLAATHHDPAVMLSFTAALLMPAAEPPCQPGYFAAWAADLDRNLRRENCIYHSSVLVRRSAVVAVGGYDETLPYAVDWDLWLRILTMFGPPGFRLLDEPLLYYRLHAESLSRRWEVAIRGTRAVAIRHLLGGGWAWRNPRAAWRALDEELMREIVALAGAGQRRRAARTGWLWLGLNPLRRWRWRKLRQVLASTVAP